MMGGINSFLAGGWRLRLLRGQKERRADELLRENLTRRQLLEFNIHGYITVIGGTTGAVYRIKKGTIGNVLVLREGENWLSEADYPDAPRSRQRLCFEPTPPTIYHLPVGDIMLAQKIILENDEVAALRIAGRY